MPSTDEILAAAWTHCAPSREQSVTFPRGFWPDVARVAVEMALQQTLEPQLDFRPTQCGRGGFEKPKVKDKAKLAESILQDIEVII